MASNTWLVVHNPLSEVMVSRVIEPHTDLRAVLLAARDERIAAGWVAENIGDGLAFFCCSRAGQRILVSIERREPQAIGSRW